MYVFDPPGNYTRVTVSPGDVAGLNTAEQTDWISVYRIRTSSIHPISVAVASAATDPTSDPINTAMIVETRRLI